ncbi:MAG: hypothetical protein KDK99_05025, partial [Verrucomicrobiales bacterium]|nr:hypothetical protein [Verrucomicrobiales bacterium]
AITREDGSVMPIDWVVETADAADLRSVRERSGFGGESSFSLAPRALADAIAPDVEHRANNLNPEAKRGFWRVVGDRLAGVRDLVAGMSENNRTLGSLQRERQFRLRSRQRELVEQGMDALSPDEMTALERGHEGWRDRERLASIFEIGKLVSKTRARKEKRYNPKLHGDYDGAPAWLPREMYSKNAGLMPDQLAQAAYDASLIPAPTTDALWEVIGAELDVLSRGNEAERAVAAIASPLRSMPAAAAPLRPKPTPCGQCPQLQHLRDSASPREPVLPLRVLQGAVPWKPSPPPCGQCPQLQVLRGEDGLPLLFPLRFVGGTWNFTHCFEVVFQLA